MNDNLYDVLMLNSNCSIDDIKKSYKKLSLIYHPDKQINSNIPIDEQNDKFIKIRNAYEILSDPNKRKKYDNDLSIKKITSVNLTNIFSDFKNIFSSDEYIIFMNILDNKIKQMLLNNIKIDDLLNKINKLKLIDILNGMHNFNFLDIEISLDFSLQNVYNNQSFHLKYDRVTKNIFDELIFPIDNVQIYENEGEKFNNYSGNLIIKINTLVHNYQNITYQILDKDLYAIVHKKNILNDILNFTFLDDKVYEIDINKLDKNITDFGTLYYIENMGLPYYDTSENEIDIKKCVINRGKLYLLFFD